jgi:biotin carboxylase
MRKLMESAGIPTVRFRLCRNFDDLKEATADLGGNLVAKPIGGTSSYGTFLIPPGTSPIVLRERYEQSLNFLKAKAITDDVIGYSTSELRAFGASEEVNMVTDYLVEEYVAGTEVSVNSIVQGGRAMILLVGEQIRMDAPYFMQLADRMPYQCSGRVFEQIRDLNQRTITAFGITDSPVHLELRLSPEGPRILEIACRMGGDNMHDAVYQITGYNLMYEAVKVALGERRLYSAHPKCHIAARYLLPWKSGTIRAVRVADSLRRDPSVTQIQITVRCGDPVAPPPSQFDFLGYLQARGGTPEEAQSNLERAIAGVRVVY